MRLAGVRADRAELEWAAIHARRGHRQRQLAVAPGLAARRRGGRAHQRHPRVGGAERGLGRDGSRRGLIGVHVGDGERHGGAQCRRHEPQVPVGAARARLPLAHPPARVATVSPPVERVTGVAARRPAGAPRSRTLNASRCGHLLRLRCSLSTCRPRRSIFMRVGNDAALAACGQRDARRPGEREAHDQGRALELVSLAAARAGVSWSRPAAAARSRRAEA